MRGKGRGYLCWLMVKLPTWKGTMGVKGLQTYMENYCPEACYRVSIKDLIETYRRETDREPVIVVDGSSCLRHLYGDLEWIQGGQLKEYVNICVSFVKAFESVGARLVFYFDGATIERKRPTWIERRVRSSIRECDEEIAEYALRNRCFAILGQDTDYIIFEGAHYYLSIMRLDLRTMTTLNYNRWALARYLGIQPYQLPLLASLVGNDVVPADDLRSVAGYVRTQPSGPAMFQALPAVAHTVFYDERRARQLESSIRSYHVDVHASSSHHVTSTSHWDMVLTKACELHVQCEIPNLLWSIMAGLPYEQSTGMEDFRIADLPPSAYSDAGAAPTYLRSSDP
uniref:Constitutive coactivator of peroxisome proliferator-activated receptor gamma n=1 Tax=Timema cristinae TaxID=61476 RepID=A0A7R9GQ29_TIMCR|nr:unnamed protein product [Timema cristinae]